MVDTEGEFVAPPEAPVFEPTVEEFQDPLAYINKIRPIAEKTGICKVRPPADWQPPFAVDVENFKFTPRVQRLNELEAKTRIKLNFLDQLAKFWELQGTPLKIPLVERKYLDLYQLHRVVTEEGGFENACKERKWTKVAGRLNYPAGKGIGSCLRTHYEKIIYPFDIFQIGATTAEADLKEEEQDEVRVKEEPAETGVKEEPKLEQANPAESPISSRRSKRIAKEEPKPMSSSVNKELLRLQFKGPGPKMAVPDPHAIVKEEETAVVVTEAGKKVKMKTRDKRNISYVDMYVCHLCNRGDGEESMLLCDSCDDAFHTYCLIPPLHEIPKGDWRCPKCVAKVCNKPKEAYGFEQAKKEYTLQSFGEMADQFKLDYFNMPVHMVPCSTVEKEFWRLVNCIEEDVLVEYGADIHAQDMGSGFPTKETRHLFPDDEEYINAGWNLNNLPVLEQSVLRHITADICGMKIPWCYVGMCFSSFCWHIEDHWSYSINYMHWGEPKTWYGVSGSKAELLEECMKKNAPELFEQSPDLLHQLTTIMNPNVLMAYGVPIVRTDQCAGEFVITFPRAYHAGFNQGYNFAEAVNFTPADWIQMGYGCIEHYRQLKRQCVFSHEELVCKMAADPDSLDLNLAAAIHQNMLSMVEDEKKHRKILMEKGTTEAEREAFELLPDDERQCKDCKTTCFLSAVTCTCSPNELVCIQHYDKLCKCPASKLCLRYRYTLDELPAMLHRLKVRAESFDNWAYKVKTALEAPQEQKLDLSEMRELITEAQDKKFPDSPLLQALIEAVTEAEQCANVASQLVSQKVRTRHRQAGDSKYMAKLSLEELKAFSEQVNELPCRIREAAQVEELLKKVIDFQADAQEALTEETPNSQKLEKLLEFGTSLDVELPEVPKLKQVLQQAKWLDDVRATLGDPGNLTLEIMRKLIENGVGLAPHPACEKAMADLQELLTASERMEEKARVCLQARPRHVLATLDAIVAEALPIPAFLPNIVALQDALRKAKEWTSKVEALQAGEHYPYLDVLESLVTRGRPVPVRLDQLPQLESQVAAAKSWRERTARTFLKKNSNHSLLEVLSPRTDIGQYQSGKLKRKRSRDPEKDREREGGSLSEIRVDEQRDPAAIVSQFKQLEQREVVSMNELRARNLDKQQQDLPETRYCVCRKGPAGFMLQCELCKDWFHSTCVPLPKSSSIKSKNSHAAAVQAARDLKFLCPLCLRSRRPRLETILSLLVSLQKLPVRMPEGEALQCLTERAMAWQDRARQALATEELAAALAKLSVLSQRMVEAAAREKTEKIISAELLKAASNPELLSHIQNVAQGLMGTSEEEGEGGAGPVEDGGPGPALGSPLSPTTAQESTELLLLPEQLSAPQGPMQQESQQHPKPQDKPVADLLSPVGELEQQAESVVEGEISQPPPPTEEVSVLDQDTPAVSMFVETVTEVEPSPLEQVLPPGSPGSSEETQSETDMLASLGMSSEHAYSTASKIGTVTSPRAKHQRKSALVPRQQTPGESPVLELSRDARRQLEKLMMEGDLLEVSLDETQHIWRILQACMTSSVDKILQYQELEAEINKEKSEKLEKKEKKKRKREALGGGDLGAEEHRDGLDKAKKKKFKLKNKDGKDKLKFKDGEKKWKDEEKKKKKFEGELKKKKKSQDVITIDDDNNDDDCSAVKCLKPTGEEVNWVQCDGCELWFHLLCVGLGEDEVSENEDYVCYQCKKGSRGGPAYPSRPVLAPPQGKPRKVMAPKPKKPVDEAITKSYKDFLDELDMNEIGKTKLRTLEKSLSQGGADDVDGMEVEISDDDEEEEEDEEDDEEEMEGEGSMMGNILVPQRASPIRVPSVSPVVQQINIVSATEIPPPSMAAAGDEGQDQGQMEEHTIVIS